VPNNISLINIREYGYIGKSHLVALKCAVHMAFTSHEICEFFELQEPKH
jgi:hypothetical protein